MGPDPPVPPGAAECPRCRWTKWMAIAPSPAAEAAHVLAELRHPRSQFAVAGGGGRHDQLVELAAALVQRDGHVDVAVGVHSYPYFQRLSRSGRRRFGGCDRWCHKSSLVLGGLDRDGAEPLDITGMSRGTRPQASSYQVTYGPVPSRDRSCGSRGMSMVGQVVDAIFGASVGRSALPTTYPAARGRIGLSWWFHLPGDIASITNLFRANDPFVWPVCEPVSARKVERAHRTLQNYQCEDATASAKSFTSTNTQPDQHGRNIRH